MNILINDHPTQIMGPKSNLLEALKIRDNGGEERGGGRGVGSANDATFVGRWSSRAHL